jgi:hypothetical protein
MAGWHLAQVVIVVDGRQHSVCVFGTDPHGSMARRRLCIYGLKRKSMFEIHLPVVPALGVTISGLLLK